MIDCAIHDLDLVCWMAGETPESVYATGHSFTQKFADCNDPSSTHVQIKFPSGTLAQIEVSRDVELQYDQRVEVSLKVTIST